MRTLTPTDIEVLLDRFHGFHDANYQGIELVPPNDHTEKFSCRISLLTQDHNNSSLVKVIFYIDGIEEMQIRYHDNFDYPNVRDDIAIKTFEGKIFFDLGFAATAPLSPEDIRKSDIYFVGNTISFEEIVETNAQDL